MKLFILLMLILNLLCTAPKDASANNMNNNTETSIFSLSKQEQQYLKTLLSINMHVDTELAPYSFIDNQGNVSGIIRDLAYKIEQRLNIKINLVGESYPEIIKGLNKGRIQSAAFRNLGELENNAPYRETIPVIAISNGLFARKGEIPKLKSLDKIKGKTIIFYQGIDLKLPGFSDIAENNIIIYAGSVTDALKKLINREADAYFDIFPTIIHEIKQNMISNIEMIYAEIKPPGAKFLVNNELNELTPLLNRALSDILQNEMTAILQKWNAYLEKPQKPKFNLTQSEYKWIKSHPVIKVASDPDWAPLEFVDKQGQFQGLCIDYLKKVEAMTGLYFDIARDLTWDQLIEKAKNREIDMFSSMSRTRERSRYMSFTDPYLSIPIVIFTNKNISYVRDLEEFEGKKLAVVKGYAIHEWIAQDYPKIRLVPAVNMQEAVELLHNEEVSGFAGNIFTVSNYIGKNYKMDIKVAGKTPYTNEMRMAARKDMPQLVSILQKALDNISETEHNALYQRWIAVKYEESVSYSLVWKILLPAIILIVIIVLWNRKLTVEINRRKAAEYQLQKNREQLYQSKQKYKLLVENQTDFVLKFNRSGEILYVSPSYCNFTGRNEAYFIGNSFIPDFIPDFITDEDKRFIISEIEKKLFVPPYKISLEHRVFLDNKTYWLEWTASAVHGSNPEKFVASGRDITYRKKVQEKLRQARNDAESANQAKSMFLANISHEIRTPMNAILGFADIMNDEITDTRLKEYLALIHSSGKSLLTLINDILDLSRIEAGKLAMEYETISIRPILNDIKLMFLSGAAEKNLELIVNIAPGIPKYLILDQTRVQQILSNLIGNAVKFTDSGYVKVSADADTGKAENLINLKINVEDTGIGIPDNKKELVFNAFEQQDAHINSKYGGTGLGLAISRHLANMMNAEIFVASKKQGGTIFSIVFKDVKIADIPDLPAVKNRPGPKIPNFCGSLALIADDLEYNRILLKTYLDKWGFEILEAQDGREAVKKALDCKPDIILMDIKMPVMDGREAAKTIKKDNNTKLIPVIAVTASAMKETEKQLLTICDGFLAKPVSKTALLSQLERFLEYSKDIPACPCTDQCEINTEPDTDFGPEPVEFIPGPETIKKLPELIRILKQEIEPQWENMNDALIMDDIVIFASKLKKTGSSFAFPPLSDFGEHLINHTQTYNIMDIKRMIADFPGLIEYIEQVNRKYNSLREK